MITRSVETNLESFVLLIATSSAVIVVLALLIAFGVRRGRLRRGAENPENASRGDGWTWVERAGWISGIIATVVAVVTVVVQVFGAQVTSASEPPAPAASPTAGREGAPGVTLSRNSYTLESSSWITGNHEDKVDLDTGYPGYGSSPIHLGTPRPGGPAEIILEDDRVHGTDLRARYTLLPEADATYAGCARALRGAGLTSEIPLDRLSPGTRFCVSTDEGRVSLVHVVAVKPGEGRLVIAFTSWEPRSSG